MTKATRSIWRRTQPRRARRAAGDKFHEVYVAADLATCEQRDPKGLYKKARAGEIQDFTGISAPYEAPAKPDLHLHTGDQDLQTSVTAVYDLLAARGLFAPANPQ